MSFTLHKSIEQDRLTDFVQGISLPQNTRLDSADRENIKLPDDSVAIARRSFNRPVAAIPVEPDGNDGSRLGPVQQLQAGTRVGICGPGFNNATVLVKSYDDGQFYFVFLADLIDSPSVFCSRPI